MTQGLSPEAAGMVFRRCRSPLERRAVGRLLAERGIAVAAGVVHQGLDRRLVCEVADSFRALGAARLVARLTDGAGSALALLRSAGFAPAGAGRAPDRVSAPRTRARADDDGGWWELEL